MSKFNELYKKIIGESNQNPDYPKLIETKEEMSKMGPITIYKYQNDYGTFEVWHQPYGDLITTGRGFQVQYVFTVTALELKNWTPQERDTFFSKNKQSENFTSLAKARKGGQIKLLLLHDEYEQDLKKMKEYYDKLPFSCTRGYD